MAGKKSRGSKVTYQSNSDKWGTCTHEHIKELRERTVAAEVDAGPSKYATQYAGGGEVQAARDNLDLTPEDRRRYEAERAKRTAAQLADMAVERVKAVFIAEVRACDLDEVAQLGADSAPYTGGYRD